VSDEFWIWKELIMLLAIHFFSIDDRSWANANGKGILKSLAPTMQMFLEPDPPLLSAMPLAG
jgi:hypothetical protein